jgi:hypothetical protein
LTNCKFLSYLNLIFVQFHFLLEDEYDSDVSSGHNRNLEKLYFTYIRPLLRYACELWDGCTILDWNKIEKIQHEAARIVTGLPKFASIESLYFVLWFLIACLNLFRVGAFLICELNLFHDLIEGKREFVNNCNIVSGFLNLDWLRKFLELLLGCQNLQA